LCDNNHQTIFFERKEQTEPPTKLNRSHHEIFATAQIVETPLLPAPTVMIAPICDIPAVATEATVTTTVE